MTKYSVFVSSACAALFTAFVFSNATAVAADMGARPMAGVVPAYSYRWYLEGRFGVPLPQDYDINITGLGPATYRPETGWHAAVAAGVQFSPNWRAELEFTYSTGSDGSVTLGGANFPHAGRASVYTFVVNGYYSFTTLSPSFQPFIGAGIGIANVNVSNLGAIGGAFVLNDSDTTLALALHVGVDVPITTAVSLTARYTLAHTGSVSFASVPAGFTTTRSGTVDHIFSGGVRVYLN